MTRRNLLERAVCLSIPLISVETISETKAVAEVENQPPSPPRRNLAILLNQVGYRPQDQKRAIVASAVPLLSEAFEIISDTVSPKIHFGGSLKRQANSSSDNPTSIFSYIADFGDLKVAGRFRIRLANGYLSTPFSIGDTVYHDLLEVILPYFDSQICGSGSHAHGACHANDGIIVGGPRDGQPIDASGGWHDAGDYLKFVETTSFVTAVMAMTAERFMKTGHRDRNLSQMREETIVTLRVGLDWLIKMFPQPEEFYYQVGNESDHDTWRLPEKDTPSDNQNTKPRPVYWGVGANLAGRVTVSFAIAARLFSSTDRAFAKRCRRIAESAYILGIKNQKVLTTLPSDFYPERSWQDDMEWAGAELYRTTKNKKYLEDAVAFSKAVGPSGDLPGVYSTHALAHYSLYEVAPPSEKERLLGYIKSDAEIIRKRATSNLYGFGTPLVWGTAEAVAGAGILCHLYAHLSGDTEYSTIAHRQRDFLLGCNPWGISFVIGAGSHYPLNPHHQISNIRGTQLTGALVGGPTSKRAFESQKIPTDLDTASEFIGPTLIPDDPNQQAVYYDIVQNYVTNEPANDYTVKFLLLTALNTQSES